MDQDVEALPVKPQDRCGNCTMCCKICGVMELEKSPHEWCEHCDVGVGCKIYANRPQSCQEYTCLYLCNAWVPGELRPDRCKVMFESQEDWPLIFAFVDPGRPDAWKKPLVMAFIEGLARTQGRSVVVLAKGVVLHVQLRPGATMEDVFSDAERIAVEKAVELSEYSGKSVAEVMLTMTS